MEFSGGGKGKLGKVKSKERIGTSTTDLCQMKLKLQITDNCTTIIFLLKMRKELALNELYILNHTTLKLRLT